MRSISETQVVRIRLSGLSCRSKEQLLSIRLAAVPGVQAAALGDGDILTTLLDTKSVDTDKVVAAIVSSGLVPEEVLEAPGRAVLSYGGSDVY